MTASSTRRYLPSLRLPVWGAPLFIISTPNLVVAQCKAGIVGSMPALNARPISQLDEWLAQITEALAYHNRQNPSTPAAPFAVNLIVHKTNQRLEQDIAVCAKYKVPWVISSLWAREDVNRAVHGWGGKVMHDVIDNRFAHKAIEKGADGLIAVAAGAGGHAGFKSPFALVQEIRMWFDGPLALSGSIATGHSILAAIAMGADWAYIGSPFIATQEARASSAYKQAIVDANSDDIINTNLFTGVHANYLSPSIRAAGLNPHQLPDSNALAMDFSHVQAKAWKDIWGCGQGIAVVDEVVPVAQMIARLEREYQVARTRLNLMR